MIPKIKLIIADKQELFRKSLYSLLKTYPEFDLVGDAADGKELSALLKKAHADIVLLDASMPGVDGRAILEIIHRRFPDTRVIVLSDQTNSQVQTDFMANGANSFLNKNCDVKTLCKAIHKVKSDGFFFDDSTSKALLDMVLKEKQRMAVSPNATLNNRETDVLKQICDGRTNKEIAMNLHLSSSTIDFYRTKIYSKTKCNNVAHLLKYALRNGLVALT